MASYTVEYDRAEFQHLFNNYNRDPGNAENNWSLGRWYEQLGHTASALSFYLRAAERTDSDLMKYECMLRAACVFESQGTRGITVKGLLQHAIAVLPRRPEAYLKLAFLQENTPVWSNAHWHDSYNTVSIALSVCDWNSEPLRTDVNFPGKYALLFQKAHTAWWCGLCDESRDLFLELYYNYDMNPFYAGLVKNNLIKLGVFLPEPELTTYKPGEHELLYEFPGLDGIGGNHSESFQDMFVLMAHGGKTDGTYLEIGSARPKYGNNTALLEDLGWWGVGIDLNENFVKQYTRERRNPCVIKDATLINWDKWLPANGYKQNIDYLQIDVDPSTVSLQVLKNLPLDQYQFGVITFEHDHYCDSTGSVRSQSRQYLESYGYVLVAGNISPDDNRPYEDWWVHPDLVDPQILERLVQNSDNTKRASDYIQGRLTFDWGAINDNAWFKGIVSREIFQDRIYEKFFAVEQGDVVVDIGASSGPFSWSILENQPSKIICLEPHAELYNTLTKNLKGAPATLINSAIGDTDGLSVTRGLFSQHRETHSDSEKVVQTIKFETLVQQNKINRIDFLKIDCEGGEYSVFTDANMDWISKNVRKIVGEWHLSTPELEEKFRHFRDTYLSKFTNHEVYSCDGVNIKPDLWSDWFIEHYNEITLYIDNRQPVTEPKNDFWKYSIAPTMEFTTTVPKKGCVVDCVFCPQRTLQKVYTGERILGLDNFKAIVDKIPQPVRISFAGFTEPWLNSRCTDMVLYAHQQGHPISVFTTGIGMKISDVEQLMDIPYAGNPNGGFVLHLPDQERKAKHPITDNYLEVLEYFSRVQDRIQNFKTMAMGPLLDEVKPYFSDAPVYAMYSRAGNLVGEGILKPELNKYHFHSVDHGDQDMTCGCDERLYHNVCLPNGDVSLCCMDYNLEHILGNMLTQAYEDVIPQPYECFKLCRLCENAVSPTDPFIVAEKRQMGNDLQ